MDILQGYRPFAVTTPLGPDVLVFRRMIAIEQMSRPFDYALEVLSSNHNLKFTDLLGENVSIRCDLPGGRDRHFNAYVSQFGYQGVNGRYARYQARLSPWLWFLTRAANCRIFQNKSVPAIVKEVCEQHGFTDIDDKLSGNYRTWTYCVQYRETDFNFVSRLLEQEGIFYFFRHEETKHTLVLADDYSALDQIAGYERVPYWPEAEVAVADRDFLSALNVTQEVRTGKYALRDYNYTKPGQRPGADLEARCAQPFAHALADQEIYDYPGAYLTKGEADTCARLRLEEEHAEHEQITGSGTVGGLAPGCRFTLTDYPRDDQNREYLVVGVTLDLDADAYESADGGGGLPLTCRVTAIDSRTPYRPARITPKPVVEGLQTAVVTGPAGEEIYTDPDGYGTIKVQFHWDREGNYDENSSCWVRVGQTWASKGFGSLYTPRIGDEVIVAFLEGDPGRPLVIGSVYNGANRPPQSLPAANSFTGVRSNSTKGGGGYNLLFLDDTKGKEKLSTHAQYDMDTTVEHDLRLTIHNNRTSTVDVDDTETVKGNQSVTINGTQTITVDGTRTETVNADESITINAARTEHVTGTETVTIDGNTSHTINANFTRHATGNYELTADGNLKTNAGKDWEGIGGKKATLDAPTIKIEAKSKIEIVCGGSSITLEPQKITIASGSGMIDVHAPGVDVKGAKIQLN
jgi:type VI secretion system secreted protein VgrG